MKIKQIIIAPIMIAASAFLLSSCGGDSTDKTNDSIASKVLDSVTSDVTEVVKTLAPGKTPFDFPTTGIKAEAGDIVLIPNYKMWDKSIQADDATKQTYIFYKAKLQAPGDIESEIDYTFDGAKKMPNAMAVVIPKGQTAKKGDVVLTWWQTGSGMQRAIVTDATNPKEPTVIYLDLDYENPAKDSKSGKSIGQTEYQLAADSFVKLTGEWQQGNMIAAKEGDKWRSVQIINVAGDKVLCLGFAGKMKVYPKADCKPIPVVPNVKVGDKVQAVFVGSFGEYEVSKIDTKVGRVFVKRFGSEAAVPYGQVAATL